MTYSRVSTAVPAGGLRFAFLGNFRVDYTSETHHANSLESLGHTVDRLQEAEATTDAIAAAVAVADAFIWVHTHGWDTPGIEDMLRSARLDRVPSLTYHLDLWMGLARQRDMTGPYWGLDHFFTVDKAMASWLNGNTPVRGHYLPAGVYDAECWMATPSTDRHDLVFVGSRRYHREWPYRAELLRWLECTYGDRFRHYGGDGRGVVRGAALNQLYADARITVGDSLCIGYSYPDYWSDRAYESLGRGAFLIHPRVDGMERHFTDGEHLVFYEYGDFAQLRSLIEHYLTHEDERETIRQAGHEHVKANHTYRHRWEHIVDVLSG